MTDDLGTLPPATGQRRSNPASPFPTTGKTGKPNMQTKPEDPDAGGGPGRPPSKTDEQKQCERADGKKKWNQDAKAAEAAKRFVQEALTRFNEPDLGNREFGAMICEVDGEVVLSDIYSGSPILDSNGRQIVYPGGRPSVDIPVNACGGGKVMAWIHSHPGVSSGSGVSGQAAIASNQDYLFHRYVAAMNNVDPNSIEFYTVTAQQIADVRSNTTRVFKNTDEQASEADQQGDEVNPEAKPCS